MSYTLYALSKSTTPRALGNAGRLGQVLCRRRGPGVVGRRGGRDEAVLRAVRGPRTAALRAIVA